MFVLNFMYSEQYIIKKRYFHFQVATTLICSSLCFFNSMKLKVSCHAALYPERVIRTGSGSSMCNDLVVMIDVTDETVDKEMKTTELIQRQRPQTCNIHKFAFMYFGAADVSIQLCFYRSTLRHHGRIEEQGGCNEGKVTDNRDKYVALIETQR